MGTQAEVWSSLTRFLRSGDHSATLWSTASSGVRIQIFGDDDHHQIIKLDDRRELMPEAFLLNFVIKFSSIAMLGRFVDQGYFVFLKVCALKLPKLGGLPRV